MHKSHIKNSNTTLYIGELDRTITGDMLKKLFGKYGTVASITLSEPQVSKSNFGYVRMSSIDEARKCVEKLDNFIVNGSPIMVRF